MSKLYLAAFVLVAGSAVAGVDYINQAKVAGSRPGQFGPGAYIASIQDRFISQRDEIARATERREMLAMAPRDHLPEAPEGWTRHDWSEDMEALFGKRYDLQADDFAPDALKNDPTLQALTAMDKAMSAQRDAREVWVYEKPGTVVAVRASIAKPGGGMGGIPGMAMTMAAGNIEAMSGKEGFAVVQGVTWREELGLFGVGADERDFRVFSAKIGSDVRLSVRARAEDDDILTLLKLIDYDRLNGLLETPVAGIGSAAPDLPGGDSRAEANRRVQEAAAAQRAQTMQNQFALQEAALELNRRMGSLNDEEYERAKAKLDAAQARAGGMAAVLGAVTSAPQLERSASAEPVPVPAAIGGGLMGLLGGLLGGATGGSAGTDTAPAATKTEVKVNRLGGNCTVTGGVKRCSISGG